MAMNSTSNNMKSCQFCGKVFSESNELWKHLTSVICNGNSTAEPVRSSAPHSEPSDPVLPKSVTREYSNFGTKNPLANNDIISSQSGSPNLFGCETSPKRETEPVAQPSLLPDAPRNSVPLKSASKDANSVFQGPSTQSSDSLSMNFNFAPPAPIMPQASEVKAASEFPRVSSPLSAPSLTEPAAVSAAAGYGRLPNSMVRSDFPCGPVSSQLRTSALISESVSSKWKCTLCNIDFNDKSAMVNHVKSQEHEARIQVVNRSAGDAPFPTPPPRESASPRSLPKEELVEIVRQVVAEELPALLRSELRAIFNAAFKDPSKENASGGSVASFSPPDVSLDARCISTDGNSLKCHVCDCSITSQANLSIHLDGKKHRANLAKFGNGRPSI